MSQIPDQLPPAPTQNSPQIGTFAQAFELALTRLFALTESGAQIRGSIFSTLVMITWLLTALWFHPWSDWSVRLFHFRLDPASSPAAYILVLIDHLLGFLLAGDTLTRLITFFLPAWLAHEIAAIYLMDIFELPKTSIGRDFISRTAFASSSSDSLVINSEKLSRKQEDSPAIRIG
ncbi:hypothetical protein FDZ74_13290, partial [bacterium]